MAAPSRPPTGTELYEYMVFDTEFGATFSLHFGVQQNDWTRARIPSDKRVSGYSGKSKMVANSHGMQK